MPRNTTKRDYRPRFESLETKQLLSGGLLTHGAQPVVQVTVPVSSHVETHKVLADGTGNGVVIITS
jgi:hypothetical protein